MLHTCCQIDSCDLLLRAIIIAIMKRINNSATEITDDETVMLSMRISAELRQRLKILAATHRKPMEKIVQRAIRREVENLEAEEVR